MLIHFFCSFTLYASLFAAVTRRTIWSCAHRLSTRQFFQTPDSFANEGSKVNMPVDPEKLAKLQQGAAKKVGGQRVKAKKVKSEQDDTKLMEALGKLKATKVNAVEEANFFKEDGKVLHFKRVGVQSAAQHNVCAFTGYPQEKDVTQLIPQILPQLGAENLEILRQLAEQIQAGKTPSMGGENAGADEDIPDLIEGQKFDEVE